MILIPVYRLLTGLKITDAVSALRACQWFHRERNVPVVVITSATFSGDIDAKCIHIFASINTSDPTPQYIIGTIPQIEQQFTGTGDLTAALLLNWLEKEGFCNAYESYLSHTSDQRGDAHSNLIQLLANALRKASASLCSPSEDCSSFFCRIASVQSVIKLTHQQRSDELLLIQSRHAIEQPPQQQLDELDITIQSGFAQSS